MKKKNLLEFHVLRGFSTEIRKEIRFLLGNNRTFPSFLRKLKRFLKKIYIYIPIFGFTIIKTEKQINQCNKRHFLTHSKVFLTIFPYIFSNLSLFIEKALETSNFVSELFNINYENLQEFLEKTVNVINAHAKTIASLEDQLKSRVTAAEVV